MAQKQRTNTLTDRGVADLQEIARRVLRKGPGTACTPYNKSTGRGATAKLPTGTVQHTYFKMVSDNQTGWGRVVGSTLPGGETF